jgi:hypothetical protein
MFGAFWGSRDVRLASPALDSVYRELRACFSAIPRYAPSAKCVLAELEAGAALVSLKRIAGTSNGCQDLTTAPYLSRIFMIPRHLGWRRKIMQNFYVP